MNLKRVTLNLALATGVVLVSWEAHSRWQRDRAARQANLNVRIRNLRTPVIAPATRPETPPAVKYADVATKNLFAQDRNPTVVIDPPKIEAPKPMPPLPVVYGVMGLPSGTKAIMAARPGEPSQSVRAGEKVGEFKVLALTPERVTFEWEGKQIEKRIDDLIDRSGSQQASAHGPAAPASVMMSAPAAPPPPAPAAGPHPGRDISPTEKACTGDSAAPGTVADGYVKQFSPSPFGAMNCRWVKQ